VTVERLEIPEPAGPLDLHVARAGEGLGYSLETWTMRGAHGDPVKADLYLPAEVAPWAWVIAMHGARGHRAVPYVRGPGKRWSRDGLVVVTTDAPYHGERSLDQSPDLRRNEPFLRQAVGDLRRLCSAVQTDARLAGLPLGYLGFSLGVLLGVPFMAVDQRVQAGVFVVGAATSTGITDPARYAPLIRQRPVLLINADRDEVFDGASVQRLQESFGGEAEAVVLPGSHATWEHPAAWFRSMFDFFRSRLGPRRG